MNTDLCILCYCLCVNICQILLYDNYNTSITNLLALSEVLQLSLDLAKNRIGSVSQDIRKLFVNIMANLIEKSTVWCLWLSFSDNLNVYIYSRTSSC